MCSVDPGRPVTRPSAPDSLPRPAALAAGMLAALGLADPRTLAELTGLSVVAIRQNADALGTDPQPATLQARGQFFSPKAQQ